MSDETTETLSDVFAALGEGVTLPTDLAARARQRGQVIRRRRIAALSAGTVALVAGAFALTATALSGPHRNDVRAAHYAVTGTVRVGNSPSGIAVDTVTHVIYVANSNDDNAVSTTSGTTTIVPSSRSGTVSVVDGLTDRLVATISVGSSPAGIAVNLRTHV